VLPDATSWGWHRPARAKPPLVLPILQRLACAFTRDALIVAPTRELAEQIHQTIIDLGKGVRVKSVSIYGGVSKGPQASALRRGAEIVVACPGRLLDHIGDGASICPVRCWCSMKPIACATWLTHIRLVLKHLPRSQTLFFRHHAGGYPHPADSTLKNFATVQIGMNARRDRFTLLPDARRPKRNFACDAQADRYRSRPYLTHQARAKNLARDLKTDTACLRCRAT
jgi:ATP-dependent RNA helicase RhlE